MQVVDAINKLKSGIENNDEELIEEGFYLLTGERIVFPEFEDEVIDSGRTPIAPRPKVRDTDLDFTMNKKDIQSTTKKKNKFSPDMIPDEEAGFDLIDDNIIPTPRNRPAYKEVKVFCQDCSKTISINPQFQKDPYTCDLIRCGQTCPNLT
jgi:hypothetical protein